MLYKDIVRKISIPADKKTKQKDYIENGDVPIIDQGQVLIGGYTNDSSKTIECNLPVIVFGDHTKCVKYISFPFGAGADGIKILSPKECVTPKYLYYLTYYLTFKIEDKGYARHYQHIEKKEVILPLIEEQQRIVTRIEEMFSELDNAVATLKETKQKLAVYRQAVLKEAFDKSCSNEMTFLSIDCILAKDRKGMTTGPFGTMLKKHEHQKEGVPVLGIENIGQGKFVDGNKIFVTEEKAKELKSFILKEGDIIISRSGTVGEICIVPKHMENSLLSTNLMRVSLDTQIINPEYFVWLFQSKGIVIDQVKELCKGSTRMFLNQTILKQITFPVPSIEIQKSIVFEIEKRMSMCNNIEKTIDTALQQSEALRQSILKKAFEGGL